MVKEWSEVEGEMDWFSGMAQNVKRTPVIGFDD